VKEKKERTEGKKIMAEKVEEQCMPSSGISE